jgi:hypothetical protein
MFKSGWWERGLAEAFCMVRHLVFHLCYWSDRALVGEEDQSELATSENQ